MNILCVMRIPPDLDGHGGSQRAWRLVEALARFGPVHFVLISRAVDKDASTVSLDPLRAIAKTVTSIDIPEWNPTPQSQIPVPKLNSGWADIARMRSQEAPVLSRKAIRAIAEKLPMVDVDLLFAGRLCSAVICQALIDRRLLNARAKIVDFDDVMSRFRVRQRKFVRLQAKVLATIDAFFVKRAERRIATSWDAVSVCTDEDVASLKDSYGAAHIVKVPNVIERPALPQSVSPRGDRILFVGNLSFPPNVEGLRLFLTNAWPMITAAYPGATLDVVGLHPGDEMFKLAEKHKVSLHPNVPAVEPFYARCDIVIAPILIGSGTRIKILEAMAYNRVVVATTLAAEGMKLVDGEHVVLADSMPAFAQAVVVLIGAPDARSRIAAAAKDFVTREYGVTVLMDAVARMIPNADPRRREEASASTPAETAVGSGTIDA